jgi:hypothetical protein
MLYIGPFKCSTLHEDFAFPGLWSESAPHNQSSTPSARLATDICG